MEKEWMSVYQKSLINDLELEPQNSDAQRQKQLCRALQKLTVLSEALAGYETETRTQGAGVRTRKLDGAVHPDEYGIQEKTTSDFEKNFYKLMNNSTLGKTMENLRNRVDMKIVRSDEAGKIRRLVASPLFSRLVIFSNGMAGIDIHKSKLLLNKNVYTGMTILENRRS